MDGVGTRWTGVSRYLLGESNHSNLCRARHACKRGSGGAHVTALEVVEQTRPYWLADTSGSSALERVDAADNDQFGNLSKVIRICGEMNIDLGHEQSPLLSPVTSGHEGLLMFHAQCGWVNQESSVEFVHSNQVSRFVAQ